MTRMTAGSDAPLMLLLPLTSVTRMSPFESSLTSFRTASFIVKPPSKHFDNERIMVDDAVDSVSLHPPPGDGDAATGEDDDDDGDDSIAALPPPPLPALLVLLVGRNN